MGVVEWGDREVKQAKKPIGKTRHRAYKRPKTGYYEAQSTFPLYKWSVTLLAGLLMGLSPSMGQAGAQVDGWKGVVIHISDSDHMTEAECDEWHRARGWDGCGYSFVVQPDGSIYEARGYERIGAHTLGKNRDYLGFCFVTKDCANKAQVEAFLSWLAQTEIMYGSLKVYPHRKFANKVCPGEVWHQILSVFTSTPKRLGQAQFEMETEPVSAVRG